MTGRRRLHAGRVLGALAFAWLIGSGMAIAWRAASLGERFDEGFGMPRRLPEAAFQPITPLIAATIALAVLGFLLATLRPRVGFVLTAVATAVFLAAGALPFGAIAPMAGVCALLVRAHPVRRVWPWLLAVPVVMAATGWGKPLPSAPSTWGGLVSLVLWTVVPSLVVLLVRTRREASARERDEALRQAAADERLRVARDIHDVVGHSLSMIALQSGVALRVLDADPDQVRRSLEAIRSSSGDALVELRHTLGLFRGDATEASLAPTPTLADVPTLVADAHAAGVAVTLTEPDAAGVPAAVQTVAYRVVQEALTNAMRHAPGAAVRATLVRDAHALRVEVTDDGGPGPDVTPGAGLTGMRERVEALGGRLTVTRTPTGLTVSADLPWEPR